MFANHPTISNLIACEGNSETGPFPSSSHFKEPFLIAGVPSLLLLARLTSNQINPQRQATATTIPIPMPAMAPEARCEDDLEASRLLDGLDTEASAVLDGLDTGKDEDVVANVLDQQTALQLGETGIPLNETVDEVVEILFRGVVLELLEDVVLELLEDVVLALREDVEEDSTALASATETFAFGLWKFDQQTLI